MSEHALERNLTRPARDWLHIVSLVLVLIGMGVAAYLSYAEVLADTRSMVCPSHGATIFGLPIDCGTVNLSRYAKVGPLPVALMGLGGYVVILAVLLLKDRIAFLQEYWHLIFFGLTLFGFAFSLYLTWAEIAMIRAFCSWCMMSAIAMTLLFLISLVRLWQNMNAEIEDVP